MQIDDQMIRRYLLGSASEEEEEALGVRLIEDESLEERLDFIEHELLEDHLDGSLSPADEKRFTENFLSSPRRVELLNEIKVIRSASSEELRTHALLNLEPQTVLSKPGFLARLSRPAFAFGALLALVLLGVAVYLTLTRDSRTAQEIEYAAVTRRLLNDGATTAGFSSLSLVSSSMRDADAGMATYVSRDLTDQVVLRLALRSPQPEGTEIDVEITKEGKHVFIVPGRVFKNPFGSELRTVVPKDIFQKGLYQISIRPPGDGGRETAFHFRID